MSMTARRTEDVSPETPKLSLLARDRVHGYSRKPAPVSIRYGGRTWATVPALPPAAGALAEEAGAEFTCQLPPARSIEDGVVEAVDPKTGDLIGRLEVRRRPPLANGHGLLAADVLAVHDSPLFAVPTVQFDGRTLVVFGAFLPPHGDPSLLKVEFGPGVAYRFEYPLPSPEYAAHYWYWPNAEHSTFRISIDLPGCELSSDPFEFDFVHPAGRDGEGMTRRRVHLPRDLQSYIGYPSEPDQLKRVQTYESLNSVTLTGYNVFRSIAALLTKHGVNPGPNVRLLDFGCGHGRVTRHFLQNWQPGLICGSDIDGDNVDWARRHLPVGDFRQGPLWPPSPYDARSFDALFAVSVMTHLTADAQEAWLKELARILKPGGLALLTFAGPGAAAFSSVFRDPDWWAAWRASGFDDQQPDPALDGQIDDAAYYRNTLQTEADIRRRWVKHFEIVEVEADLFGYQSVCVLRSKRR